MTALLLQRTSLQAEIELPLESTKLKSESGFWWHFRERWETLIVAYFSSKYVYIYFFVLTSWDYLTQGASHTMRFTLSSFHASDAW